MENISLSSSATSLRVQRPADNAGGAVNEEGNSAVQSPAPRSPGSAAAEAWSPAFHVTRIHRHAPNQKFYDEVIAPLVANSLAGQSYVFLVNGAGSSGRSYTLYGSSHHKEKGLVELTAMDLLQRVAARREVSTSTTPPPGEEAGTTAGTTTAAAPLPGGLTVTFSAFLTRGRQITETAAVPGAESPLPPSPTPKSPPLATGSGGALVPFVNFPPPLGNVPLAHMQLLQTAAQSVVLPEKRASDTSSVIQFQVYAPVQHHGTTRAFATLTFVDVAVFKMPLCREVQHLFRVVQSFVDGESEKGRELCKETALTTFLEPTLSGGAATLINLTTISGRQDLYESTVAALGFAAAVSRVRQVVLLTHIRPPRWVFEGAQSLEQQLRERREATRVDYALGVRDYWETVEKWVERDVLGAAEVLVSQLSRETETVRDHLRLEVSQLTAELEGQLAVLRGEVNEAASATKALTTKLHADLELQKRLSASLEEAKETAHQRAVESARKIGEIRVQLSEWATSEGLGKQEALQMEKSLQLYAGKLSEMKEALEEYSESLGKAAAAYRFTKELAQTRAKRARLELELVEVSQLASQKSENWHTDRERRQKKAKLEALERRVEGLRLRALNNDG